MGNGIMNIAKGRIATYGDLGAANDAIVIVLLKAAGLEADDTLNNYDDLAALLAGASDEADFGNYARKTVTSATVTIDDTANRVDIDIADQTWTAAGGTQALGKLLACYDADTTSGTDSNIVPVSYHDFTPTTDGSDLVAQVAAAGLMAATAA